MAKPTPNLGPQRREGSGERPAAPPAATATPRPRVPVPSELDIWSTDDSLRQEMERLAAENQQMIAGLDGGDLGEELARLQAENEELRNQVDELRRAGPPAGQGEESARLQEENEQLRRQLDEVQQHLATSSQGEEAWAGRQKEYEELLEQKSEVIRTLHQQIEELRNQPPPPAEVPAPAHRAAADISEDDLHAMAEELERERQELEEARRQLEDDERSMMQQMRDMEMQMSRERAELARQRNELQRLHSDIRHELERAKREDGLGERLRLLQRRHAEVTGRGVGGAPAGETPAAPESPAAQPPAAPGGGTAPPRKGRDSGLLRRLFGSGK